MNRTQPISASGHAGFSLPEVLVTASLLGLVSALAMGSSSELLARARVEATAQWLLEGIQKGRSEADRLGRACGLSLDSQGWKSPLDGTLPPCQEAIGDPLVNHLEPGVQWISNFPTTLRFTANGLVIDGGTAVVWGKGTTLRRCLVMSLPLGVVRLGRYGGQPPTIDASACSREDAS